MKSREEYKEGSRQCWRSYRRGFKIVYSAAFFWLLPWLEKCGYVEGSRIVAGWDEDVISRGDLRAKPYLALRLRLMFRFSAESTQLRDACESTTRTCATSIRDTSDEHAGKYFDHV